MAKLKVREALRLHDPNCSARLRVENLALTVSSEPAGTGTAPPVQPRYETCKERNAQNVSVHYPFMDLTDQEHKRPEGSENVDV